MTEACNRIKICGFLNAFSGSSQATNQAWISMFCCSEEKAMECKRNLYILKMRQMPPDNMAPTGSLLCLKKPVVFGWNCKVERAAPHQAG